MTQDINTVLADPKERTAHAYFEASVAVNELLDVSERGWDDLMVLIRQTAKKRRAMVMEDALEVVRPVLTRASNQQDTSDKWTGKPAPEDREIDANITGGND
ncbi:MAG: hypothetical protein M3003_04870 [Candidatus Dormibacteraeota bacterium]|nr:hypothetical protein [Candidatus Dormibacteraeota bacterium]